MTDYIAWLNGQPVAKGTMREVELKAREIFSSALWQEFEVPKGPTVLKITRGPRQLFAKSVILGGETK